MTVLCNPMSTTAAHCSNTTGLGPSDQETNQYYTTVCATAVGSTGCKKRVRVGETRVGEICVLKVDDTPRAFWPLVRIHELHGGNADVRKRSARVKTANRRTLDRPIRLLFPLEEGKVDPLQP